ncbi:MFS transporter [Pseudalkalibacillus decolorationis]|uniref:MFS transporter n=1 Tax=Pseudalkalibacillus decolorationis TaxID=163879 RepID=UPI0021484C1B|nr:MFS transporter [Pseudalkalibacillus decolorationis]
MGNPTTITKDKIWTRDFIFVCISNFFIFAGFQMTLPTLPLFVNELGGSDQLIGLVVGIFTFSALLIRPWSGHVLETLGRRFVYLTGLIIFVLSVATYSFASSIIFLFLMRIVQGLGWGMSTTAVGTIATDMIPARRRGEGMGYFGLAGNLAMAFGPALGLVLVVTLDFSWTFMIAAFAGVAALIIASLIRYTPGEKATGPKKKWDIYEKSALVPALLLFFITMTFGGITSFLPLYAEQQHVSGIEWYFFVFAISLMIVRAFAGRLYDRKGHKAIFIPGALMILLAMIDLSFLENMWMLLSAALFFGIGFGAVQPALQAWAVQEAPKHRRGMANATFFSFFDLGVGSGAIFFGFIASWFGYSEIYLVAAGSVIISIFLYILLTRNPSKQTRQKEAVS